MALPWATPSDVSVHGLHVYRALHKLTCLTAALHVLALGCGMQAHRDLLLRRLVPICALPAYRGALHKTHALDGGAWREGGRKGGREGGSKGGRG